MRETWSRIGNSCTLEVVFNIVWNHISDEKLEGLISTMPHHLQAMIDAYEKPMRYPTFFFVYRI